VNNTKANGTSITTADTMPIQQESGGKVPQNSNILKMSESLQSINRQMIKYKNQPYEKNKEL
jgi:hypothetical protein